jgi:hypothetical protein
MSLCAKTATEAPEPRTPATMDAWLRASETIREPGPASAGRTAELVAKPMPKTTAASTPRKDATSFSSWARTGDVPPSGRAAHGDHPSESKVAKTRGVQYSSAAAKPR